MKNKTILVLILVLTLTGCSVVRIDTSTIDNTINVVLSKKNNLYNRVGKGYKYYIPRGVSYIDTNEFNEKLYSNGVYYYLYIDAVSYFHKKEYEYTIDNTAYYSKVIDINNKKGYLQITEVDDKYLVEFTYNYAKIEALVDSNHIEEVVLNSSYILSTVKFNDNVIKLMLDEEYLTNKEEKYDIFEDSMVSESK